MKYSLSIISSTNWPKPYLALLTHNGRKFTKRSYISKTFVLFKQRVSPGDIIETRCGQYNDKLGKYDGGKFWFQVEHNGNLKRLEKHIALDLACLNSKKQKDDQVMRPNFPLYIKMKPILRPAYGRPAVITHSFQSSTPLDQLL